MSEKDKESEKEELEKERDDFKALTKFQKIKAIMKNEV